MWRRRPKRVEMSLPGLTNPDTFGVQHEDDSMDPQFLRGDVLIFSPQGTDEDTPRDGDFCWLKVKGRKRPLFRQLFYDAEGFKLVALNSRYPVEYVKWKDLTHVLPLYGYFRRVKRAKGGATHTGNMEFLRAKPPRRRDQNG